MSKVSGFILREVAGSYIVVAIGKKAKEFNGMITLNETGAFIWKCLEQDKGKEEIVNEILENYQVDRETATVKVEEFLDKLVQSKIIERAKID